MLAIVFAIKPPQSLQSCLYLCSVTCLLLHWPPPHSYFGIVLPHLDLLPCCLTSGQQSLIMALPFCLHLFHSVPSGHAREERADDLNACLPACCCSSSFFVQAALCFAPQLRDTQKDEISPISCTWAQMDEQSTGYFPLGTLYLAFCPDPFLIERGIRGYFCSGRLPHQGGRETSVWGLSAVI